LMNNASRIRSSTLGSKRSACVIVKKRAIRRR
jgi:hypothetical protein